MPGQARPGKQLQHPSSAFSLSLSLRKLPCGFPLHLEKSCKRPPGLWGPPRSRPAPRFCWPGAGRSAVSVMPRSFPAEMPQVMASPPHVTSVRRSALASLTPRLSGTSQDDLTVCRLLLTQEGNQAQARDSVLCPGPSALVRGPGSPRRAQAPGCQELRPGHGDAGPPGLSPRSRLHSGEPTAAPPAFPSSRPLRLQAQRGRWGRGRSAASPGPRLPDRWLVTRSVPTLSLSRSSGRSGTTMVG